MRIYRVITNNVMQLSFKHCTAQEANRIIEKRAFEALFDGYQKQSFFRNGEDARACYDGIKIGYVYQNGIAQFPTFLSAKALEVSELDDSEVVEGATDEELFFAGSRFDTDFAVEKVIDSSRHWFAVEKGRDDCDWSVGSFDFDEAVNIAKKGYCTLIAEIDGGYDENGVPTRDAECVAEYESGIDF